MPPQRQPFGYNPYYRPQRRLELPGFNRVPIELIAQNLQQTQQRYDVVNQTQAEAFAKLNEIPVTSQNDAVRIQQLKDQLHNQYNKISQDYNFDLAKASGDITTFISEIRKDPFWKLNEYALQQKDALDKLNIQLNAMGKHPLVFQDLPSVWDPQTGKYKSQQELTFDVEGMLDYQNKRDQIATSSLQEEGGEGSLPSLQAMGNSPYLTVGSWKGVNKKQVLNKMAYMLDMYKDTEEYIQEKKKLMRLEGLTEAQAEQEIADSMASVAYSKVHLTTSNQFLADPVFGAKMKQAEEDEKKKLDNISMGIESISGYNTINPTIMKKSKLNFDINNGVATKNFENVGSGNLITRNINALTSVGVSGLVGLVAKNIDIADKYIFSPTDTKVAFGLLGGKPGVNKLNDEYIKSEYGIKGNVSIDEKGQLVFDNYEDGKNMAASLNKQINLNSAKTAHLEVKILNPNDQKIKNIVAASRSNKGEGELKLEDNGMAYKTFTKSGSTEKFYNSKGELVTSDEMKGKTLMLYGYDNTNMAGTADLIWKTEEGEIYRSYNPYVEYMFDDPKSGINGRDVKMVKYGDWTLKNSSMDYSGENWVALDPDTQHKLDVQTSFGDKPITDDIAKQYSLVGVKQDFETGKYYIDVPWDPDAFNKEENSFDTKDEAANARKQFIYNSYLYSK